MPPCDTPGDFHPAPDALSRAAAEAAWRSVTPSIAGTPHVRVSRDGGRTFPARHARPLPADPPGQPATVPVYDPGSATGRMLALDLDPSRIRSAGVDDRAVQHGHEHRAGPAAEVAAQAAAIAGLVARCGGQVLADVAPSGGRHVFVLFAAALPWRELRDLARAIALRFPAVDPAPMASLGGQITPPGSRHKSGGWRLLSTPLSEARAAVEHPNGPEVWAALLTEFAAELQVRAARSAAAPDQASAACLTAELDDTGAPWVPRLGGRAHLGAELDRTARTGRWDRSRYPDRSGRAHGRPGRRGGPRLAAGRRPGRDRLRRLEGPRAALRAALRARPDGPAPALEWRKSIAFVAGRKTCVTGSLATVTHAPLQLSTALMSSG